MNSTPLCLALLLSVSPTATTQTFTPAEQDALQLKGTGHYAQAQQAFTKLLLGCEAGPIDAAMAEYYAILASLMANRIGDHEIGKTLAKVAQSKLANQHPSLKDRLLHIVWDIAQREGDLARATELANELGCVRQFWIIGPFDNERGAGYGRQLSPEKELDLDATYPGKNQALRWRKMSVARGVLEQIPLATMLRPNQQVLAYASVALVSENEQDILLHMGSSDAYKVLLNGQEQVSRDISRSYNSDQDTLSLHLQAGANLLMIKVCAEEGGFEFSARIRAADGKAVRGLRISLERKDMLRAALTKSAHKPRGLLTLGARAYFADSIESSNSVADKFRLALLLALDQVENETDRKDLELLRQVVAQMPDFASARYLLAFTRIRAANRAEEREDNQRRHDYLQLLQRDPQHAESLRSLAELELSMNGAVEHGEELLLRALAINPDFRTGQLELSTLYQRRGFDVFAQQALEAAARPDSMGRRPPLALRALLLSRMREKSWPEAITLADRLLREDYGPASILNAVALHLRIGQSAKAIAILQRAELRLPYLEFVGKKLAEIHAAMGEHDAAVSALSRWLTICPNDVDALIKMANLQGLLGHDGQRLELLRAALELNPNLKTQRRLLEFLQADELPFYADYELSFASVTDADAGPPKDCVEANDPYYHLLRQVVIRAYGNGTRSTYEHHVIRVLNQKGAQDLSQYNVAHFRGEQRARLLAVRVHRKDGKILTPAIRGSYVRFPPLETGDCIEIRSRVDDLAPSFFGEYFGLLHHFGSSTGTPINRSELTLILDPGRTYRLQTANGAPEGTVSQDSEQRSIHEFQMRGIARREFELQEPNRNETDPLLRVTTYADWNQFSAWWWNLIRRQSMVSPAISAKVQELTSELEATSDKIAAIYRFVTTDIRYKAWEFGVHGYKPYSTPVIFERRHGDCKDKALLLNAMLGEIGVDAFPVLIYANPLRSHDDLSLPMVEHFNHCISYLPASAGRPALYLDGTAIYHPTDTLPDMDKGAKVLVVNNGEGSVQEISWGSAKANLDATKYDVKLNAQGGAVVNYSNRPTHNQAIRLRQVLGNEPGKQRKNLEIMLSSLFGDIEIEEFETSDALDLGTPLQIDLRFSSDHLTPREGQGLALKSLFGKSSIQNLAGSTERNTPLLLGSPSAKSQRILYRLPPGFAPLDLPEDTVLHSRFGSYKLRWSYEDGKLTVERYQVWLQPRISPEEYPEFREYAGRVDAADQQIVIVNPGGGR